jgi:hypothetical protein
MTRPLIGTLMGIISYYVISVGFVTITPGSDTEVVIIPQVLWLAAFIVSFSDQLADKFLRTIAGRFGGDENGELMKPASEEKVREQLRALTASLLEYHLANTNQQQGTGNTTNEEREPGTEDQMSIENASSTDDESIIEHVTDHNDALDRQET